VGRLTNYCEGSCGQTKFGALIKLVCWSLPPSHDVLRPTPLVNRDLL